MTETHRASKDHHRGNRRQTHNRQPLEPSRQAPRHSTTDTPARLRYHRDTRFPEEVAGDGRENTIKHKA
ncbi:hypothetical protein C2S52_011121 [Perilla frutescens var. hirtella]|nr:hypothetical protein C2S52_011121 [Perilla frutescens var. hirtella]KAH6817919.1 hypothetical protein C2S51_001522 [Perilla frutescens var. frutescens]